MGTHWGSLYGKQLFSRYPLRLVFVHFGMLNQVRDGQPHGTHSYAYCDPLGGSDHSDAELKVAGEKPVWVGKCEDS
jgi:hypothetical protein